MDIRSLLLLATVAVLIPLILRHPFVGTLAWAWISFMSPISMTFTAKSFQLNLLIAALTLGVWALSPRKEWNWGVQTTLFLVFTLYFLMGTIASVSPDTSWYMWDRLWKGMLLILVVVTTITTKVRIQALVWVICISIAFWALQGGLRTIASGGGGGTHFTGPANSILSDRNHFAVGVVTIIPLINYLRLQASEKWVRYACLGVMGVVALAVVASQSRGGFIALAAVGIGLWLMTPKKVLFAGLLGLGVIAAIPLLSEEWVERMETISTAAEEDASFRGRLAAWRAAYDIASQRFIGAGPRAPQTGPGYFPFASDYALSINSFPRAAHSIYFEVLGDLGWPGLFLFLMMLLTAILTALKAQAMAKPYPELAWIRNLAAMIPVCLAGYMVGGAAVSLAYWEISFTLMVIPFMLTVMARRAIGEIEQRDSRAALEPRAANDASLDNREEAQADRIPQRIAPVTGAGYLAFKQRAAGGQKG